MRTTKGIREKGGGGGGGGEEEEGETFQDLPPSGLVDSPIFRGDSGDTEGRW
jgi:hypothetical protein